MKRRKDGCSALGTKSVRPLGAAFGGLHVQLRFPGKKLEAFLRCVHVDPICRAGQRLAIGAMANSHRFGIDFGLVRDVTAMASALNVHGDLPIGDSIAAAYHRICK